MAVEVNELVTRFTFKGAIQPLAKFRDLTDSTITSMAKYSAALFASASAGGVFVNATLQSAKQMVRLSQDTGIAVASLQKFEAIARANGSENFQNDISNLADTIGSAATSGNDDLNRLGVSVRDLNGNIRSVTDVAKDLSKAFKTLDIKQQRSFASSLGIDRRSLKAFDDADEKTQRITKSVEAFGVITEDQTKQLDKFYSSIELLRFGFSAISQQIALTFAPILTKLADGFADAYVSFKENFAPLFDAIRQSFGRIGGVAGKVLTSIGSFFKGVASETVGLNNAILGIGTTLAVVSKKFRKVGIFLVLDDLISAFQGGKSVIADFFKDTFDVDIVDALTKAFEKLIDILKFLKKTFKDVSGYIKDNDFSKMLSDAVGGVSQLFGGMGSGGQDTEIDISGNMGSMLPSGNTNSTVTNTQNNNVTVSVVGNDPILTGKAVVDSFQSQLETANANFNRRGI